MKAISLGLFLALPLACATPEEPSDEGSAGKNKPEEAARKDVDLTKRQCRGVHLVYTVPTAKAAYIEVTPEKTCAGTYFCALGFKTGYLGIQDLGDRKRLAIFTVWEPGYTGETLLQGPKEPGTQVVLVEKGENVFDGFWGGEDATGQSRLPFRWETGKPVRFFLEAKPIGGFTDFTARIFDPVLLKWKLIATFRTRTTAPGFEGLYSFIEDFRRNYDSARVIHRASYTNGWVMDLTGKWVPILEAKFTGDTTPSGNIDAGPLAGGFFLQTGGDTENKTTRLRLRMNFQLKDEKPESPESIAGLLRP
ncbi:DUF3472 domain-containing protein [Luteolibacter sp. LG18]|uniref:DUF3472 domain-containing protein n=1 Tax=Luteolibacter sp. LG18 TaxID=2819286 RepID=UPI002B2A09EC|nr:hypothetical protein llg_34080 [Luteolibacter sp. LG18]